MNKIIIIIPVFASILFGNYGWPLKEFNTQHQIIGTFGEYRTGHFHSAVDINAPESTMVWNIESDTCYKSGSGINIGHFRYYHLVIRPTILDSSFVAETTFIAKTDSNNHVHLMESRTELRTYGAPTNVWWLEPLRSGALTPYVDSTKPHIDSIKFYRQGPGDTLLIGILDRRVDVLSVAGDARTDSTGHSAGGNCSVYRIGYEVKDTLGNVVKSLWEKIKFDSIYNHEDIARLNLTYGSGSTMSHFRYWVSNDPFNPDSTIRNWYWNTKQKIGQPDSVDADSIEDAKFKDGYYWVKVIAADI
ncbi:MAG: hypothetical protein ACUVQ9_13475, partial [Thermodesulfobacteriota bacterium]